MWLQTHGRTTSEGPVSDSTTTINPEKIRAGRSHTPLYRSQTAHDLLTLCPSTYLV